MVVRFFLFILSISFLLPDMTDAADSLSKRYLKYALQGQLQPIVDELLHPDSSLSENDQKLVEKFNSRFGPNGSVEEPSTDEPFVKDVVIAYREYWSDVFFNEYSKDEKESLISEKLKEILNTYSINVPESSSVLDQVKTEFENRGYQALTGMTLPHYDLLSWGTNEGVDYNVELTDGEIDVRVYFMSDFVSYGWSHYATFGKAYPGGWAGNDALYCMKDDYDRESEKFRVSYLQHEARHFADYKLFPKLKSTDLEYRAKLTEFIYADTTLFKIIEKFTKNSARVANAPHSLANHEVLSNFSKLIFDEEYVDDIDRWKKINPEKIHSIAKKLLIESTEKLTQVGADTTQGVIYP